ncbi:uncharacterized protein N7484_008045, partial [Penicillium longicatenatum]|uniref:uncharacterized protein n=1 Tax=Penicillium longicatenatum TaxID=1561947 RepID=UPI002549358E
MESSPGPSVKSKSKKSVAKKKSNTISIQSIDLTQVFDPPTPLEEEPKPPRQERWVHRGDGPLLNANTLPKRWNMNEPDLDPDDIDAQIARCKERIQDNIMTFAFEERLKEYKLRKQYIEYVTLALFGSVSWLIFDSEIAQGEPEGLSVDLLFSNQVPEKHLSKLNGNLHLTGLVTYWSHGDQLCQPRPFNWEEFDAINDAHEGYVGFWVEGKPQLTLMKYNMAFRIPGYPWWTELDMLYDTGSQATMIFEGDVRRMMGPFGPPEYPQIRIIGNQHISGFGGDITCPIIALEVTVLGSNRKRLTPWIRVPVGLQQGDYNPAKYQIRCDGPFISRYLYTASAPNQAGNMHFATNPASLRLPWMESRNAAGLNYSPEQNMGNFNVKERSYRKNPRPKDMPDPGFR